jgi:hypothetical protein
LPWYPRILAAIINTALSSLAATRAVNLALPVSGLDPSPWLFGRLDTAGEVEN